MRVVYFHQYFVTPEMAGGTRSYEFARRLVADGHDVHIITSDPQGGSRRSEWVEGIAVQRIPVKYSNSMGPMRRILAFLQFAILASIAGMRTRPTVVFASSTPLTIVLPALATKIFRRVPMVFEVRDLWPEMPIAVGALRNPVLIQLARLLERIAYKSSRKVIALSPGMRDGVVEAGYPESRVVVIPNSSDIERFQVDENVGKEWLKGQAWHDGTAIVLYAGTIGLINGLDFLVDVANESRKMNAGISFLIVGHGKYRDALKARAQDLGVLNENLFMMESVPKKDLPTIYSAASIATSIVGDIPNVEKNSANKFFDSLAAGRPIAINHGGWQQDLIEEWQCGLRLSRDPKTAVTQLVKFVEAPHGLESAGKNALNLAKSQFDRDKLYETFRDTLISSQ